MSSEDTDTSPLLNNVSVARRLYISHFLSTWNSRVFEFGAILFLAAIFPDTLLPSSLYALIRAASAIALAAHVGRYIDRGNRLDVVRLSIVAQRAAVVASCVGFGAMMRGWRAGWVQGVLAALACVEKLGAIMNTVAVEKDWVVVIARGERDCLRQMNSKMRRIDLACKLVGPLAVAIVDRVSTSVAIGSVLGLNVISVLIEYPAIAKVYYTFPDLQIRRSSPERTSVSIHGFLRQYLDHPAFLPSFALSLLYFTVLSFNGQLVTYLLSLGHSSATIGYLRTLSVASEMSATWLAPLLMSRIGPIRAGLWFINWQALCVVAAASLFSPAPLIAGVIASRAGLWGFDLCVQTIIQEEVELDVRGMFSAVESSVQNMFELASYAATIVWARPEQFRYPVLATAGAVAMAGGWYARFVRRRRGHLVHGLRCGGEWKEEEDDLDDTHNVHLIG